MENQPTELSAEVARIAGELGVPGAAVGVDRGDEREIATYGVTRRDHGVPIDETTLFQVGSTAKTLTATLIMVLVDRGLIELDRPVRHYLPELALRDAGAAETVTVGQLLNHTAGWDGGDSWPDTGEGDDALQRAVALIAELPQQFAVGTSASYNNAAFLVAGRVAEAVTGESYERALSRLLLEPLGLRQTATSLNEIMTRSFAIGHRPGPADQGVQECRPWSDPRGYLPAGARLASSVVDQLGWARFQLGDGRSADGTRVLSDRSLPAMHTPTTPHELMPGVRIGIGWLLREIDGVRLVEHHGDVSGQHSTVTVVPERDCGIVVLTNSSPTGRELAEQVVRHILETRLGLIERAPEPLQLTPAELTRYVGTYRTDGIELRIVVDGPGLIIHGTISGDGDEDGETLAFPVNLLPGDRYLVVDGPFTGLQGEFVSEGSTVVAARHVGRWVPRADAQS